ncbi:hypothetical protein [Ktedonospora formicarum]|uniref:Uncharacterized protein n=1 Tax=Ktedonospora formicarum TaxID=2778364 RepID=A0A8J3MTQ8_9CHLR|nr:hypothetical protein [Ktedonospora formicarum]GHO45853.1 hypothetical protein KSX_40160 [Ktedonospora formicarum]
MNARSVRFLGGLIVMFVALLCSLYYLIPGYEHLLVTHDAKAMHPTHAIAFFAIAIVAFLVALVSRPQTTKRQAQQQ